MHFFYITFISILLLLPSLAQAQKFGYVNIAPPEIEKKKPLPPPLVAKAAIQLAEGCHSGDDKVFPLADIAPLRYLEKAEQLTDRERKLFVAASFSQDPEQARLALAPLLEQKEDQKKRFLAASTIALILSKTPRAGNSDLLSEMLNIMEKTKPESDLMEADRFYFLGLKYELESNTDQALQSFDQAIALDKKFFNAIAHAIYLQVEKTERNRTRGRTMCRQEYDKLLDYAATLMDINPCPLQSAHLSIWLRRQFTTPDNLATIQALEVYLATLSHMPEAAALALTSFREMSSGACENEIAAILEEVMSLPGKMN